MEETPFRKLTSPTPYPVGPVHLYEFTLQGMPVLFDTGAPTPEATKYLTSQVDLARLRYLFITHCHPDHYGLIRFVEENSDAEIVVSRYDALIYERYGERVQFLREIFHSLGFPDEAMEKLKPLFPGVRKTIPFAKKYHLVEESDELLQSLGMKYIACPGHSQSDIIYLIGDNVVSGDVLLRGIFQTPLLDLDMRTFGNRFCNYSAYCKTILQLKNLENRHFLPGHRDYIETVDDQILFYVGKVLERAKMVLPYLNQHKVVFDALIALFPNTLESDPFYIYIKTSEILFIMDFLNRPDILANALKQIGIYERIHEQFERINIDLSIVPPSCKANSKMDS